MHRSHRLPWAVLGFLVLLLAMPVDVAADAWSDARTDFRNEMKSPEWVKRRDAFLNLADFDEGRAVREILIALQKESNGAVIWAGLDTLGAYKSRDARKGMVEAARKEKGRMRLLVLNALERHHTPEVTAVLLEVALVKDPMAAAQAALILGLGEKPREGMAPVLQKLLKHKDWQVRSAAARSLARHPDETAVPALAAALLKAKGVDRGHLVRALEATTKKDFGLDPDAWRRFARGEDPEKIRRKPRRVPTVFGVPIYGQRVVVVLDNSLRMSDPHPFDGDRLRELCETEEGAPIVWFRMKTSGHFAHGHLRRLVSDMPKGTKLGLVVFNERVNDELVGFQSAGSALKRRVLEILDALKPDNGIASYDALNLALDLVGAADGKAWKSGPDEIVFINVNMPTAGEVKEANVISAAIGLKGRMRMVPIHTVGIHLHPYDMCREIAERTGGTYVNLVK